MRGKTRARDLASSRHHVDDSIRYLGLLQQLGEEQRAEWRLLGWLEDHAVAAGEGRRELPRGHEQREVPRDDLPHHADRLAQRVAEVLPRKRYLLGRSIELGHPAGVVAKCGCGQRHVKQQRVVDRHPVVERLELRELTGALLEHVAHLPQDLGPFRGRQLAPHAAIEGPTGGGHRAVDILGARFGDPCQNMARRRVERLERFSARRLDPASTDEELLRFPFRKEATSRSSATAMAASYASARL